MERLFFALWPDEDAAQKLAAVARDIALRTGGRPMRAARIHLTIAFLGSLAADRAHAAREAGAATRASPFDLVLDQVGSFGGARVAWAGCERTPPELTRLRGALAAELAQRGFALEERGFAPHATLVRRIEHALAPKASEAIAWRGRELTLVRSEPGRGDYRVVSSWPLAGA